jgi:predicted nuclease of predicted toxin-antitoxin system
VLREHDSPLVGWFLSVLLALSIRLYFDHNVNQAIVQGLRLRGLDVLTAREDGTHRLPDPDLLDRATAMGRVLVSSDIDLVVEARRRQHARVLFGGVVYMPQLLAIGLCVEQLQLLAEAGTAEEFIGSLEYLPLR